MINEEMKGKKDYSGVFFSVTDKMADDLELEDTCLRDSISIASTDSFVSAAEVRINHRAVNNISQWWHLKFN